MRSIDWSSDVCSSDLLGGRCQAIGFVDDRQAAASRGDDAIAEAGGEDDRQVGSLFTKLLGQLQPTHLGHDDIREDRIHPGLRGKTQRFLPGRRADDLMAELAEKGLGEGTHVFVVVDDQDAADKGRVLRPGLSRRLTSGRLLVAAGEHDGDGRALSGRALYEHVAAGLGREAIDLTETEARALADADRKSPRRTPVTNAHL